MTNWPYCWFTYHPPGCTSYHWRILTLFQKLHKPRVPYPILSIYPHSKYIIKENIVNLVCVQRCLAWSGKPTAIYLAIELLRIIFYFYGGALCYMHWYNCLVFFLLKIWPPFNGDADCQIHWAGLAHKTKLDRRRAFVLKMYDYDCWFSLDCLQARTS